MHRLLLCMLPFAATSLGQPAPPSDTEPPLRIEVRIGDLVHTVIDGEEAMIAIAGKPTRVAATVAPARRFRGAGVEFDYPRHMHFDSDLEEDGLRDWSLDGITCEVCVHQLVGIDPRDFAHAFLSNLASAFDATAKVAESACRLGGKEQPAFAVTFRKDGRPASQRISTWVAVGDESVVVTVSHDLKDGTPTAESTQVFDLLAKTFALTKK
jgi:hypothetical protein